MQLHCDHFKIGRIVRHYGTWMKKKKTKTKKQKTKTKSKMIWVNKCAAGSIDLMLKTVAI